MSNIYIPTRKPMSWWDMVSPREEEMPDFLRAYMGKGKQFRTPRRVWEDLWRLKRGHMNSMLSKRHFGTFKGPKYQKGIICATAFGVDGSTSPNLQNVTHVNSQIAPTQARIALAYDSDGSLEFDGDATTVGTVAYTDLTTASDDANNHTNDWWPDQPDVNEGLNWDIQYNSEVHTGIGTFWAFYDTGAVSNRTTATWYLLDTVSNDHADASTHGAMAINRGNGTAKNPDTGSSDVLVDVEIRATGSGSAVASHSIDFECNGAASDIRLKKNIVAIGTWFGVRLYTWEWNAIAVSLGIDTPTTGVLAQEVQETHPDAVYRGEHGYLKVNYSKIF